MSRTRTRPTRDETKSRLFDAAAQVFEDVGIGSASIDAIATSAGLTRGAFYSNFADKDELIMAMLEDHAARSAAHHRGILAGHKEPVDFIDAMKAAQSARQDPLGRAPLLHMELLLFMARAEKRRPELVKRLRARRALAAEIVGAIGIGDAIEPAWAGAMLLALDDGFRIHRLIDPNGTSAGSFQRAVETLVELVDARTSVKPAGRRAMPSARKKARDAR